jgi:Fe-S cluster assembly iron-binding protein IscA
MIAVTERAAEKFKAVVQNKSLPEDTMLRVDVETEPGPGTGAGQSKLFLKLDPHEPSPEDAVEVSQGVRVAVDRTLAESLGDKQLDYLEEDGVFVFARM